MRDAEVIEGLKALVEKPPRWGFWKCRRRLGHGWSHKRIYRVYCAMKLNHKRRLNRRVPTRERKLLVLPQRPNLVWSPDFMSDGLYGGRRFCTFNVLHDCSREALAIAIDTSITSRRVVRVFRAANGRARTGAGGCAPANGPEFLGEAFTSSSEANGVLIRYIQPGKPNQNAYIERFNRTYREELLDLHLFARPVQVREITHGWMIQSNEERPQDAVAERTPIEHFTRYTTGSSSDVST
jgi:putative transposase